VARTFCTAACLLRKADQHVGGAAELLQLHVTELERGQLCAHGADIGGAGLVLHLHERTALEVDAEIQAMREEQRDRRDGQQCRGREADAAELGEVELRIVGDDAERRQQVENGHDRQNDDQCTQTCENHLCRSQSLLRPLRSARAAAAST
jgi:hypothetical protein